MKNLTIKNNISIKEAMKYLDKTAEKVLLVIDEESKLKGTLSDGDVRRAILSGKSLENSINDIYNSNPTYLYLDDFSRDEAKKILLNKKIELIPLININKQVVDYITWDGIFGTDGDALIENDKKINIPVVIMAGGKGTRLEPFTKILPKPLVPIGDKTIAELIMEQFAMFGVNDFYYTLNYKGDMIKAYFNSIEHTYNIKFVHETEFLGTAGSLKLLESELKGTFILSNCDILVKADYSDVLRFHMENNSELTVLSAIMHHKIPYGIVSFGDKGAITGIQEKPEHSFTINTGVYLINSECLKLIPENSFYHLTDLIEELLKRNRKIFTYPVNTDDYVDIGQWDDYRNIVNKLMV